MATTPKRPDPALPGDVATARRWREDDLLARLLEYGLIAFVVVVPFPWGAVRAPGRLFLELFAFALLGLWTLRAFLRPVRAPSTPLLAGVVGLAVLTIVQAVPVGDRIVAGLSPRAFEVRVDSEPPEDVRAAETRILGVDPRGLEPAAALSLSPERTASALRTGCAVGGLILVACSVAASRGIRGLALAMLVSAAFQGLYGSLVLVSGHDMIWHHPKQHYLDCATGTFVNRNHFANFVGMTLAVGLAATLARIAGLYATPRPPRVSPWVGAGAAPVVARLVLVVLALAGLLLSFSRAGTALGLLAIAWVWTRGGPRSWVWRLIPAAVVVAVAAVPLLQTGPGRLAARYADSVNELGAPGGRLRVWRDTVAMAAAFPVVGAGFGTFAEVYPLFRSGEVRPFYDHAHNDAVQFLAEGGAVGCVLVGLILVPLGARTLGALRGRYGTVAIGVGAGLTVVLAHALVDFVFRIPANAAVAAILAGMLEGIAWRSRS